MKVACRIASFSLFALLVATVIGCGGGSGGTVVVSGLVTMDGKALEGASVQFMNEESSGSGLTDENGEYQVRVKPGDYQVAVSKYEGERIEETELSEDDEAEALMAEFETDPRDKKSEGKETIPERYSDLSVTELKFTVPRGGSTEANFTNLTSN